MNWFAKISLTNSDSFEEFTLSIQVKKITLFLEPKKSESTDSLNESNLSALTETNMQPDYNKNCVLV